MINKLEQKLDREFELMNVKPRVYHFLEEIIPFSAITICDVSGRSWQGMRQVLDISLTHELPSWKYYFPAIRVLIALHAREIYGVALCDYHDAFNRQRGRIIAKGRLLKHLKGIEE